MNKLSRSVGRLLIKKKMTIAVCESCTGGMLGSIITKTPGSSKYFVGGVIAYINAVKHRIVDVKTETLNKYGAVSAEVAVEMAKGIRKKTKSDIGIGITGIAGPTGGSKMKSLGLVYIAITRRRKIIINRFLFKGSRETIRRKACKEALILLRRII